MNEKEELLLELFPTVANKFLQDRVDRIYGPKLKETALKIQLAFEAERQKYLDLSDEEKQARLIEGLYTWN
jgi:oxaloacetate decarboxylase alpha subunit/pyruvate carboxylase subunit B